MPLSARQQERTHNQTIALPIYQAGEAELPFDSLAENGVGARARPMRCCEPNCCSTGSRD